MAPMTALTGTFTSAPLAGVVISQLYYLSGYLVQVLN